MGLQACGILFVEPGMENTCDVQTYDGMLIGEHSHETDLEVSPPISILDILVYVYL
jgi:predicted membrane GTPase involved in stress response